MRVLAASDEGGADDLLVVEVLDAEGYRWRVALRDGRPATADWPRRALRL